MMMLPRRGTPNHSSWTVLDRIKECGAYPLNIREWTVKPEEEKTWGHMKTHFIKAQKTRQENSTTGSTG